jgi:hypothetical protein
VLVTVSKVPNKKASDANLAHGGAGSKIILNWLNQVAGYG